MIGAGRKRTGSVARNRQLIVAHASYCYPFRGNNTVWSGVRVIAGVASAAFSPLLRHRLGEQRGRGSAPQHYNHSAFQVFLRQRTRPIQPLIHVKFL